uniref:Uncharacterized protein n=1 Tax=Heliothis virescens TaxID=7102 RepID=A0A2A4JEP9_HELVI
MWSIITVVILISLKNVFALTENCLHTDNECITKSIKDHVYEKFVRGLDGVESSDPLHLDKIDVDLPNLKLIQDGGSLVTYELLCPRLVIKSDYEMKGAIDGVTAEGKDTCEITYYNYHINITGNYEKTVDEKGKHHFNIIEFWLTLDNQAQATTEYKNLSVSDGENASPKLPCANVDECLINDRIERIYPKFVAGIPSSVDSSDPLYIESIIKDLPTISYALYNATLIGLKGCNFVELDTRRTSDYTSFDYAILCPILTLRAQYDLNGIVDSLPIEGKGYCQITYEGYHISISGKLKKVTDDDGKQHVNILDYTTIADLKDGQVKSVVYEDLDFGNEDTNNDREIKIEAITRDAIMEVFMNKYIQNLKDYHQQVPFENINYENVRDI